MSIYPKGYMLRYPVVEVNYMSETRHKTPPQCGHRPSDTSSGLRRQLRKFINAQVEIHSDDTPQTVIITEVNDNYVKAVSVTNGGDIIIFPLENINYVIRTTT